MDLRKAFLGWPVVRQLTGPDPLGRGAAVQSPRTQAITARTATADRVVQSVCPYCAVGCGQRVFVKDERVVQIEGDPDSPVSRGRLCPKGSASEQLVNSPGRATTMLYRRPRSTDWERIGVAEAIDMIADRMVEARRTALAGHRRRGPPAAPDDGHRLPGRSHPGQRGELPDQEAVHRARGDPDREPGPYLTQRHGSQSGGLVRPRRRHAASCRTWPRLTASSSRAPTWPSAIRWGSSG